VSRTTVSLVLNERHDVHISPPTRARVLEAAQELDYHPNALARQLAGGTSLTLGLVMRQSAEQITSDALLAETMWGLVGAAAAGGFRVLVEPIVQGESTYADLLRSQRTDGLVVSGPRADDDDLAALVRDGFPIVIQGSRPDLDAPSVDVDNRAGAREAVEHLIGLGHRVIGCITNAPLAYTAAAERLAGYRDALAGAGISYDDRLVGEGLFDAVSGHAAMSELLARAYPTAVFVASDVVAIGALHSLREANLRVPQDVSVVGFDDIPLAEYFNPSLTTVRVPARGLGRAAGEQLVERVAGRPVAPRTLLRTQLIVRGSSGPVDPTRSRGGP
jgi:LacI family transcriptional regulator